MATREREVITLSKGDIRLLYRPSSIEAMQSADGWDTFINGSDFRLTPEGSLEWMGDEKRIGQSVTVIYSR